LLEATWKPNIATLVLRDYMVPYPRRQPSPYSSPRE
jgi:hypothetical protein